MDVLLIATEAFPFAKSGGLGDVIGTLPKELKKSGVEARVMLPLYKSIWDNYQDRMTYLTNYSVMLSWRQQYCGLFQMEENDVIYYFLDHKRYFDRENYYGYDDDGERFGFFSKAAIDSLPHLPEFQPTILHCNEWQTAMVPVFLKTLYAKDSYYMGFKTVFTIHNIEYQGKFDMKCMEDLFGIKEQFSGMLRLDGNLNLMKGAIVACDKLTTVSPNYAEEITYPFYGNGLENLLLENKDKLIGILNGIDNKTWNPTTDQNLSVNYTRKSANKKKNNKTELQKELGLEVSSEIPLLGMVGRLEEHKGVSMVLKIFDELMKEQIQLVILGTGSGIYEEMFRKKRTEYSGKVAVINQFSEELASRIYASSDFFLMPSVSEPCGLAQMIALRYGAIPIVRETGGLKDSVFPYNSQTGEGNGITFSSINEWDLLDAVKRGIHFYYDKDIWKKLVENAMGSDYSWKKSIWKYVKLYESIL